MAGMSVVADWIERKGEVIEEVSFEVTDLDTGFDGNSHGFISESFHNPDLDY